MIMDLYVRLKDRVIELTSRDRIRHDRHPSVGVLHASPGEIAGISGVG